MKQELEQMIARNIVVGINQSTGAYGVQAIDHEKLISELQQLFRKHHVSSSGKSPHCCCDTDLVCALHPPFEYGS